MTEALPKGIAIHAVLVSSLLLRIKEFPERHCTTPDHASPVTVDRLPDPVQIAEFSERIKLKKFKVRRRDLRHFFVIKYVPSDLFLPVFIRKVKKDSKYIGMPRHVSPAGCKAVDQSAFFHVPVKVQNCLPKCFRFLLIEGSAPEEPCPVRSRERCIERIHMIRRQRSAVRTECGYIVHLVYIACRRLYVTCV